MRDTRAGGKVAGIFRRAGRFTVLARPRPLGAYHDGGGSRTTHQEEDASGTVVFHRDHPARTRSAALDTAMDPEIFVRIDLELTAASPVGDHPAPGAAGVFLLEPGIGASGSST